MGDGRRLVGSGFGRGARRSRGVHGRVTVELQPWLKSSGSPVGELAARAGVATSALRFYEAHGLIRSERNESGHRRYRPDMLRRVAFIRVAQRIGLSLGEIAEALGSLPLQRTRPATTGTSCRAGGCRVSTNRSPPLSCCAIASTDASAAGACPSIRASCTTRAIGLHSAAPGARYLLGDPIET